MTRTILCFGDSNTHGTPALKQMGDNRRFEAGDRWPDVMADALGAGWTVIAEGHPGRTTLHDDPIEGPHKNGIKVLPAILETHSPLDAVIVMLGTNDLKARFSVSAREIALSVEKLIGVIRSYVPEARILAVAPVPVVETGVPADAYRGGAAKSQALAAEMQSILSVPVFDAGSVVAVDPLDGVHLTKQGHHALGQALARQIDALFAD